MGKVAGRQEGKKASGPQNLIESSGMSGKRSVRQRQKGDRSSYGSFTSAGEMSVCNLSQMSKQLTQD